MSNDEEPIFPMELRTWAVPVVCLALFVFSFKKIHPIMEEYLEGLMWHMSTSWMALFLCYVLIVMNRYPDPTTRMQPLDHFFGLFAVFAFGSLFGLIVSLF